MRHSPTTTASARSLWARYLQADFQAVAGALFPLPGAQRRGETFRRYRLSTQPVREDIDLADGAGGQFRQPVELPPTSARVDGRTSIRAVCTVRFMLKMVCVAESCSSRANGYAPGLRRTPQSVRRSPEAAGGSRATLLSNARSRAGPPPLSLSGGRDTSSHRSRKQESQSLSDNQVQQLAFMVTSLTDRGAAIHQTVMFPSRKFPLAVLARAVRMHILFSEAALLCTGRHYGLAQLGRRAALSYRTRPYPLAFIPTTLLRSYVFLEVRMPRLDIAPAHD